MAGYCLWQSQYASNVHGNLKELNFAIISHDLYIRLAFGYCLDVLSSYGMPQDAIPSLVPPDLIHQ